MANAKFSPLSQVISYGCAVPVERLSRVRYLF